MSSIINSAKQWRKGESQYSTLHRRINLGMYSLRTYREIYSQGSEDSSWDGNWRASWLVVWGSVGLKGIPGSIKRAKESDHSKWMPVRVSKLVSTGPSKYCMCVPLSTYKHYIEVGMSIPHTIHLHVTHEGRLRSHHGCSVGWSDLWDGSLIAIC
jgi:hypothetical protein